MQKTELHKSLDHNWLKPEAGCGRVTCRNWNNYTQLHSQLPDNGCGRVNVKTKQHAMRKIKQ